MFSLVGSRALILCFYLDGAIIFFIFWVFFSSTFSLYNEFASCSDAVLI